MGYSSDLTDKEWEIIEPLLLSPKKKTRPPVWTKRQLLNGIFYQLKNGCNWCDLPRDLPPYSTLVGSPAQWYFGTIKTGVRMALSNGLRHNYTAKCANKPKKTAMDDLNHD